MDRFLGKLIKKAGGGRNKASADKVHRSREATRSPSPSLSPEPNEAEPTKTPLPQHSDKDLPQQAFETTLRPPVAPSGDRHSNYRPYRRAPETPRTTLDFPLGFSSHPYESSKKSFPPPRTSKTTVLSPARITRKEAPKKEKLPDNDKIHEAPKASEVTALAVPEVDNELELEVELESELAPSTRSTSQEIEGSVRSVERPSLDSQTSTTISPTKAERTAELLAKKYMRIIHHREELESRGILWPTSPPTYEFPDDSTGEPQVYEFPQFVPKPLILRNQREPSNEGLRSNERKISGNGAMHDYEAAKLESWRKFYGKGEMMQTLHNEIDEYLGALMFKRLLKETNATAIGKSEEYRTEVTVREYWDGVRGFLDLKFKDEDMRN